MAVALATVAGLLHGLLYPPGIILVFISERSTRSRLLAAVPGIGVLLALTARTPRTGNGQADNASTTARSTDPQLTHIAKDTR